MMRISGMAVLAACMAVSAAAQSTCTPSILAGPDVSASGDGGPALSARMFFPYGLARHADGNLYVADKGHNGVRVIRTNGVSQVNIQIP
jgi:hypothetical protein